MKRVLCLILSVAMLLSFVSVVHANEAAQTIPEKVEISFKVGDSTLMINGSPVTVETPYVVGAGTTLVPLRVITEAFGAKVTWVNETKGIILEYPDVNITLQIGNINATVNSHTEALPEAPVLSPNGVTMVPLRFISETFGATVNYDNATAAITVVKENVVAEGTISSSTDLPRIGDSYWNWSMMTPTGMMMTDRYLDGTHTLFEGEEDVALSINIYDVTEYEWAEYNECYRQTKNDMNSVFTLSADNKGKTEQGNDYFHIIGRDKEDYMDFYGVYRDDIAFHVCFTAPTGNEQIPTLTAIVESFVVQMTNDGQTHDLSNVESDGYRLVKDDYLKISFKVPATMTDARADAMNVMWLESGKSDDCTEVTVGVYSKTENVSSRTMAQEDKQFHDLYYNLDVTNASEIYEYRTTETGENPYYYIFTTDGLSSGDYQMCDVYFEKGEYIYNVTVIHPVKDSSVFKKVMETFECEELDPDEIGVLLRTGRENEFYTTSTDSWSMKITSAWEEVAVSTGTTTGAESTIFGNNNTGAVLTVTTAEVSTTSTELREAVGEMINEAGKKGKIAVGLKEGVTGSNSFYKYVVELEEDDKVTYNTVYILKLRTRLVVFNLLENEETANSRTAEEIFESIGTFEFKK